jgi:putative flippase GtrA
MVGMLSVALDLTLFALLLHVGVWYVAAKALSVVAATINGYTFNRRWTFRAGRHGTEKLVRYLTVQGTGLLLCLAILTTLVEAVGLAPLAAGVLAVPVVATYCFLGNRVWTFGPDMAPAVAPSARG